VATTAAAEKKDEKTDDKGPHIKHAEGESEKPKDEGQK